jgi:phosphinothricin acetyltransferase
MSGFSVRTASAGRDAAACAEIYRPYVENAIFTFEVEPPSAADFAERINTALIKHAWLVAESADGAVLGYAYGSVHNTRAAYDWSCSSAVYIDTEARGAGVGTALYDELFRQLAARGYLTVTAGITLPNAASIALHRRFAFEDVGVYRRIGFKLGKWHDVLWMQRDLVAPGEDFPAAPERPVR